MRKVRSRGGFSDRAVPGPTCCRAATRKAVPHREPVGPRGFCASPDLSRKALARHSLSIIQIACSHAMQVICEPHAPTRRPVAPFRRSVFFFRGVTTVWPPLKGEVPATQAVGFIGADFGRFNLWRPTVVDRTRGSNRLSTLSTGSNRLSALPTGSNRLSALPTGSNRLSATPTHNPQGNLRIRRIREVQSMLPEFVDRTRGSKCVQAQPGRQCRQEICGGARRFEEISRSDEWRLGSCSIWRQQPGLGTAQRIVQIIYRSFRRIDSARRGRYTVCVENNACRRAADRMVQRGALCREAGKGRYVPCPVFSFLPLPMKRTRA